MTVEAELRNEQLELYRQQLQVFHLVMETSVGLSGIDPMDQQVSIKIGSYASARPYNRHECV